METFGNIKAVLEDLERSNFAHLTKTFVVSDGIDACIGGSIQFFVLDAGAEQIQEAMPVVCTVGVNYTQERRNFSGKLRHLSASDPPIVVGKTGSSKAVAQVIAAFNRNSKVWTSRPAVDSLSPLSVYAAPNATMRAGLLSGRATDLQGRFLLIMTNVSPFITKEQWKFQAKLTPNACESITRTVAHLDSLYEVLGSRIDLWIGHSANEGTKWVWPHFSRFVKNHRIEHWMLTGNISPQSHLAFDGHYRKAKNPRFPWFAPERLAGGD